MMQKQLFLDGRIFTSAPGDDTLHEAMLTFGEQVTYVGTEEGARQIAGPSEHNLDQRLVLPGFIDAHAHLIHFGASLSKIECMSLSIPQIQARITEYRKAHPEATMIMGKTFLFDALGAPPHRKYLDEVVDDIPVFIDCADLHSCWLNSAAIAALGVTKDTPDPPGGSFERDADGELTGLFLETAVFEVIWKWMAEKLTLDDRLKYLDNVFAELLHTGVTGIVDMAMTPPDLHSLEVYAERHGGTLPVRVSCHWLLTPSTSFDHIAQQVDTAARHRDRLKHLAPWLRIVGVKIISDGVIDACTAFLQAPYHNGATPGPIWPLESLQHAFTLADAADLQIAVHAIGDAASAQALDAFDYMREQNGNRASRRHRVEHLELVSPESVERMAKAGIVASVQPSHADPLYLPNWIDMLGRDERLDRGFPFRDFLESTPPTPVAFGTDVPVAPVHTLPTLYTATTRQSAMDPTYIVSDPWMKRMEKHKFSLAEGIRAYTAGGAYSIRLEATLGSLEKGKSADFCVLDVDPFKDGESTLREAQKGVKETWIRGERVR